MLARLQSSKAFQLLKKLDSWITWAVVGLAVGAALGVNSASVWIVAIGLVVFVGYLALHGPARRETEGRYFASGGVFMIAWLVGFVIKGTLL